MPDAEPVFQANSLTQADAHAAPGLRHGLIAFGWLNVGLGVVGAFLPVMPTTVFLLIALWAFSKSSPRFHHWLRNHPRFGPLIHDWHVHRVIPWRAKILAVAMMTASLTYVTFYVAEGWALPVLLGTLLTGVALWIVTRPSRVLAGPPGRSRDLD
jgi:uncharacterized membrane protein YbaN (DUF454 family)